MTLVLFIPGSPAPGANLPILPRPYKTLISDTFTGGDVADINGRHTDSALGGTQATWLSGPTNSYAITNGKLVRGAYTTGISGAALNVGSDDIKVTISLAALPSTNAFFDLRKSAPNLSATITDCYRLRVSSTGVVEVQKKIGSAGASVISIGSHIVTAGGSVGLQIINNKLTLFVNEIEVESIADENTLVGSYFEIYQGSSATISLNSILFQGIE